MGSSPDVQDEECGHDGIDTVTESFHPLFAERCVQINTEGLHIVSWRLPVACDMPREGNSLGGGLSVFSKGTGINRSRGEMMQRF